MNLQPFLIPVICGLLTSLMFLGPLSLGALGMVLSTFTALPLFVSALGFGTLSGVVSGAVAAVIIGIFFGFPGALVVIGATLAPALWIGHMVGLSQVEDDQTYWFPADKILFRMALMSAVIALGFGALSGFTPEIAFEQTNALFAEISKSQAALGQSSPLSVEAQEQQAKSIATLLPFAMPISILLLLVVNLLLGQRIVRKQGWILRPQPLYSKEVALPMEACILFALAIALVFVGGTVGLIAQVVAGAVGGAFALVGLATAHDVSKGIQARGVFLPLIYVAMLFSRLAGGMTALLGVAETLLGLRARNAAHRNNSHPDNQN